MALTLQWPICVVLQGFKSKTLMPLCDKTMSAVQEKQSEMGSVPVSFNNSFIRLQESLWHTGLQPRGAMPPLEKFSPPLQKIGY